MYCYCRDEYDWLMKMIEKDINNFYNQLKKYGGV